MICGTFKEKINENVVWKTSMQCKFNTDNSIIHNKERLVLGISPHSSIRSIMQRRNDGNLISIWSILWLLSTDWFYGSTKMEVNI